MPRKDRRDASAPGAIQASTARGAGEVQTRRRGARAAVSGELAQIQRSRLLAASVQAICETGRAQLTVGNIVERASISRRTFYELFENRDDCLAAALDDALAQITERVLSAYRAERRWQDAIRAGLLALLVFLEEQPALARLCLIESQEEGSGRRREALDSCIAAIDEGRLQSPRGQKCQPLTAEGLLGASLSIIQARLLAPARDPLPELLGPLMSMIVLPYLGPAAASRELSRPAPSLPATVAPSVEDPLHRLSMRLTYRTIRVLQAIGQAPAMSNREIADAAGVTDPGQSSKLLARLEALGLIYNENNRREHPKGTPNAWALTTTGQQIQELTSPQRSD
jgi:AcrR family transcriptional regulator